MLSTQASPPRRTLLIGAVQGISDTPAWVVSKANQYAKDHGKTPFSVYQGSWSVFDRSFERDIIPMARSEGLALAPWGVLGAGKIAEEARRREKGRTMFGPNWERTPEQKKVCDVLEEIGNEVGTESLTSSKWWDPSGIRILQPQEFRARGLTNTD